MQITSASVACGFHAGDPLMITAMCRIARDRQVVIGAQTSYRDLARFGRRFIAASYEKLRADVVYQISAIQGISRAVAYVTPMACSTTPRSVAGLMPAPSSIWPTSSGCLGLPGALFL